MNKYNLTKEQEDNIKQELRAADILLMNTEELDISADELLYLSQRYNKELIIEMLFDSYKLGIIRGRMYEQQNH